jgi:hypothetical protein
MRRPPWPFLDGNNDTGKYFSISALDASDNHGGGFRGGGFHRGFGGRGLGLGIGLSLLGAGAFYGAYGYPAYYGYDDGYYGGCGCGYGGYGGYGGCGYRG